MKTNLSVQSSKISSVEQASIERRRTLAKAALAGIPYVSKEQLNNLGWVRPDNRYTRKTVKKLQTSYSESVHKPLTLSCVRTACSKLFGTSLEQAVNNLQQTWRCTIFRIVARLFQQDWYSHDITILLQPCVLNFARILLQQVEIRVVKTTLQHVWYSRQACYKLYVIWDFCQLVTSSARHHVTRSQWCVDATNNCGNHWVFSLNTQQQCCLYLELPLLCILVQDNLLSVLCIPVGYFRIIFYQIEAIPVGALM